MLHIVWEGCLISPWLFCWKLLGTLNALLHGEQELGNMHDMKPWKEGEGDLAMEEPKCTTWSCLVYQQRWQHSCPRFFLCVYIFRLAIFERHNSHWPWHRPSPASPPYRANSYPSPCANFSSTYYCYGFLSDLEILFPWDTPQQEDASTWYEVIHQTTSTRSDRGLHDRSKNTGDR